APRRRGPAYREVFRAPVLVASAAGRPCFSAEVAFLLGFGDQSSVNRAFRRWTGESPGRGVGAGGGRDRAPVPIAGGASPPRRAGVRYPGVSPVGRGGARGGPWPRGRERP